MHGSTRNQNLAAARNVDIGQVGGEQRIVFPDCRTQQQRALVSNIQSQFREKTRALEEDAFLAKADPFDVSEAVEDSEHFSILKDPMAFVRRGRLGRMVELRWLSII